MNGLIEEFADEPEVAERVKHRALKHAADRPRTKRFVRMFADGAVFFCSGSDRLAVNSNRIVHEEFDSDGSETSGGRSACAVFGRFFCEEE